MMIPRYVIIMRFPVISQTDLFPEGVTRTYRAVCVQVRATLLLYIKNVNTYERTKYNIHVYERKTTHV